MIIFCNCVDVDFVLPQHYYKLLAPTFAALIPAHQRLRFTLACAAARRSTIIIIKIKKNKNKKIVYTGNRTYTQSTHQIISPSL